MYDDLLHFLAILEAGTFTAAAKRCGLSQPAMSASIQRLESFLGAPLLHRHRSGARLTDAGRAFLPHAREMVDALERGRDAVREVLGVRRGRVSIGAGATGATFLLPPVIATFRREHPGVEVRLMEARTPDITAGVTAGTLDLGVVTRTPALAGFAGVVESLGTDPLVFVQSPQELRSRPPYLTFVPGSPLRDALSAADPSAEVHMELQSITAVCALAAEGAGRALVPRCAVVDALRVGRLVEIAGTNLSRERVLIHRGAAKLSLAAAAFRRLVKGGLIGEARDTEVG